MYKQRGKGKFKQRQQSANTTLRIQNRCGLLPYNGAAPYDKEKRPEKLFQ